MSKVFSILAVCIGCFLTLACATHASHNLESLHAGMDKAEVLNLVGNPWITRRVGSNDIWVYRFYQQDQQYRKQITFNRGKVIGVQPALAHPSVNDKLADSDNMDEFKKAAENKNQQYESGFKDIESSNAD